MPLYRCTVAEGLTSFEQRSEIAKAVTRIHCDTTGAPPMFVHAFFAEDRAGQLPEGIRAAVLGSIRAGRTEEQKARIVSEIKDTFVRVCGIDAEGAAVAVVEIPARWVMEGGAILPEPGDEAAWLAEHT